MPDTACNSFQWIGQPLTSCDKCGKPAWEHDFLDSVDSDSPFGGFVQKPWSESFVAVWAADRAISTHRAEHLRALAKESS